MNPNSEKDICITVLQSVQSDCESDVEIIFVTYSEATGSSTILVSWGGLQQPRAWEEGKGRGERGEKGKEEEEKKKGREKKKTVVYVKDSLKIKCAQQKNGPCGKFSPPPAHFQ